MSWPSSNFHHDSFEYIPPQRPEYRPVDIRINHNTNITFKGPSSSSVKTAGWLNFAGGVFNGLANLGAAWMLSKGNTAGAQMFTAGGSIFNNAFGGGYNSMPTMGSGSYLIDPQYTWYTPVGVGGLGGAGGVSGVGDNDGAKAKKTGDDDGKAKKTGGDDDGKAKKTGGDDDGKAKKTGGDDDGKAKKPDGGDGAKPTYPKPGETGYADFVNSVIDDTFDKDGDGKHGTMGADGKVTGLDNDDIFYAEAQNTTINSLEHTTSKTSDHGGIKRGISKGSYPSGEDASTKTNDGFYKYITLTDKNSNNEWTFVCTGKDSSGNPIYQFSTSFSDLSKDDSGSNKGWEQTGKQPSYTLTVDAETGKIDLKSSGNDYAATKHN